MHPFRIFFPLAGLHAVLVVSFWPLALLSGGTAPIGVPDFAQWHAGELLYGYTSAVLAGFVLTALPRWNGALLTPQPPIRSLIALWIAGRVSGFVTLTSGIERHAWIGCLFPVALALLVGYYIVAANNRRNAIVVILLVLFAVGAAVQFIGAISDGNAHTGERIGIAAALGLVMVLGGRITPALTDTALLTHGNVTRCVKRSLIEFPAAVLATTALASWVAGPGTSITGLTCAAAALAQGLRLAQWRGALIFSLPNVFVFHAAYACVPLGFALISFASFPQASIQAAAGIHAWTMGAIALMSLAVMTSMVRRQTGHPFESSRAANAAYVLAGSAALLRVVAAIETSAAIPLLLAAAVSWLVAFGLFLKFLHSRLRSAGRPTAICAASCESAMGTENGRCDCR